MHFRQSSFVATRWRFIGDLRCGDRGTGKFIMVDMFSPKQRSEIMSKVKGSGNAATELRLIEIFRSYRIRGWRRQVPLLGKPDFIFPAVRLALFIDGCFWHGCRLHGTIPESNRSFWEKKIHQNKNRDRLVCRGLKKLGWRVIRIWQHELRQPEKVAKRVILALEKSR